MRSLVPKAFSADEYPAVRGSTEVRALVNDFVIKLDQVLNQGVDRILRPLRIDEVVVVPDRQPEQWVGRISHPERMTWHIDPVRPPKVDGVPVTPGDRLLFKPGAMNGVYRVRARRKRISCLKPHCPNVAAPIYGMVCTTHRGAPPKMIAEWRRAREVRRG